MNQDGSVYLPLGQEGYQFCHPVTPDDFETINIEINGTPRRSAWTPIPVEIIQDDGALRESDAPWLGSHALIFRRRAVEALGPVLLQHGELLPIRYEESELWIYNPILIDALDEPKSSIIRFSSGRPMMIKEYVFREDVLRGIDTFKIPNLRVSPTFVSQKFVRHWNENGLKGLDFIPIWKAPT